MKFKCDATFSNQQKTNPRLASACVTIFAIVRDEAGDENLGHLLSRHGCLKVLFALMFEAYFTTTIMFFFILLFNLRFMQLCKVLN